MTVEQTLQRYFGFDAFRPGQREVVDILLAGRSALAVFPTGGGKSLCFQLPAMMLEGLTLVVSPLIALMKDQIDFLQARGVAAARLDSSLSSEDYKQVWQQIDDGHLKLLYVAPERFNSERFVHSISRRPVSLMVIDEAHCMSEWGHSFRPEYLKLAQAAETVGASRILALTATATPTVARDICQGFGIAKDDYIHTGFHRPNLMLAATPCTLENRDAILLQRLQKRIPGPTIIYVTRQQTAENLATQLTEKGHMARHYHAGLTPEERHATQDWFMTSTEGIVVATIAFGMGIDKADIRYVYHYNLPKAMENYAQEIGRAGRDGKTSTCELLACEHDCIALQNFAYGDTPIRESTMALVQDVMSSGDTFDLSVYELANRYDIRNLVVSTILCYLELEGCIASTGPFYTGYKLKFKPNQETLLSHFDARRQDFLKRLFASGKTGRTWLTIDIANSAEALNEPREKIVKALTYLEERALLEMQVSGLRLGYRRLKVPDISELGERIQTRFVTSEKRDIQRIATMLAFSQSHQCLTQQLLDYFGENLPAQCGHCDRCSGVTPTIPPPSPEPVIPSTLQASIEDLLHEPHEALQSSRALTRFLCGLASPRTSFGRPRLTQHPLFGALSDVRFAWVLQYTEEMMVRFTDC